MGGDTHIISDSGPSNLSAAIDLQRLALERNVQGPLWLVVRTVRRCPAARCHIVFRESLGGFPFRRAAATQRLFKYAPRPVRYFHYIIGPLRSLRAHSSKRRVALIRYGVRLRALGSEMFREGKIGRWGESFFF